ncbi:MAG: hypothetical protein PHS41_13345, partial [Victivallaceae bacterium]|nr:hypothetical protein [Victivallaceae bacterium]
RAKTEFVTWLDCDGILSGNCSDVLVTRPGEICIRPRTGSEIEASFRPQRKPGEKPGDIPAAVLDIWKRDVGERSEPRCRRGFSANVFTIHRDSFPFLRKWIDQMKKVLPPDVKIVADGSVAYFQTDDSVLNSLLLFADDAPKVSAEYHVDDTSRALFVHFGFNPKPWVMWNPQSIRFYDRTMEIIDWALANGYAPKAELPRSYRKEFRRYYRLAAPFARGYYKWMKIRRKLAARLRHS